jgi:CDP-diacylglycerol---glycerol-3-phosphate 3-phosphatidyltransferase
MERNTDANEDFQIGLAKGEICGPLRACGTIATTCGWADSRVFPEKMATLTGAIGTGSKWLLDKIVGAIAATGINPNVLTFLGLVVNFGAAASFAVGKFFLGAAIIFFAGFLDMLDGQVARKQNRVTAFGAFYDSTLDRYADMALYMGLLVYYSVSGRTPYVVLAAVATAGSVMVSYARARAESLIPLCKVGFMERPERLVLLIIGGVFNRMGPVLWVIAVVSTITVIHRIVFTWQETRAGRTLPGIKLSL